MIRNDGINKKPHRMGAAVWEGWRERQRFDRIRSVRMRRGRDQSWLIASCIPSPFTGNHLMIKSPQAFRQGRPSWLWHCLLYHSSLLHCSYIWIGNLKKYSNCNNEKCQQVYSFLNNRTIWQEISINTMDEIMHVFVDSIDLHLDLNSLFTLLCIMHGKEIKLWWYFAV